MKKIKQRKYDEEIQGTFGQFFTHNNSPVFYVNTSLPIDDIDRVKPVRDILDISEVDFDELVQRNLDDSRIKNDISEYLTSQSGYKFFPPIVSAFVAPTESKDSIKRRYSKLKVTIENEDDDKILKIEFENYFMLILYLDENEIIKSPVKLKWKSNNISLMAVDGQHRLVTLKAIRGKLSKDSEIAYYRSLEKHKSSLDDIDVPLTILFFPNSYDNIDEDSKNNLNKVFPNSGWISNEQKDIKEILRSIFVDVNKNAKTPSESRNILLNEKDICAIFARQIFTRIKEIDKKIYSYLLDFDSARNKEYQIDQNRPIITTIAIVYKICEILFKDSSGDKRKNEEGSKLRERLNLYGIDFDKETKIDDINPYDFNYAERTKITAEFNKTWLQSFVSLFTKFKPYSNLYNSMKNSFDELKKRIENDDASSDEIKVYEILFGGNEKRFFIQQNAKSDKLQNSSYVIDFKNLKEKEQKIKQNIGDHRLFFSQMFQSSFFEFIIFLISEIEGDRYYIKEKELDLIIKTLNAYIEEQKEESIFKFGNSINNLIFENKNNPKKSEVLTEIIKLILFNYKTSIRENEFVTHFNFQEKFIKSLNNKIFEKIETEASKKVDRDYETQLESKMLKIKIDELKKKKDDNVRKYEKEYEDGKLSFRNEILNKEIKTLKEKLKIKN